MIYNLPVDYGKEAKVCKSFFKNTFCISDGRIARILVHKNISTTPPIDQRGKHVLHNKTSDLKNTGSSRFHKQIPFI